MRLQGLLWQALAWLALGIGALGLALPLLPTTPFMLVAAAAFGRSSPRLRARILANRRLGPVIAAWEAQRAIPRRGKRMAYGGMAACLALSVALGAPALAVVLQAILLTFVALFIASRPDTPPDRSDDPSGPGRNTRRSGA